LVRAQGRQAVGHRRSGDLDAARVGAGCELEPEVAAILVARLDQLERARDGALVEDAVVGRRRGEVETSLAARAVADVLRAAVLLEDELLDPFEGARELGLAVCASRLGRLA